MACIARGYLKYACRYVPDREPDSDKTSKLLARVIEMTFLVIKMISNIEHSLGDLYTQTNVLHSLHLPWRKRQISCPSLNGAATAKACRCTMPQRNWKQRQLRCSSSTWKWRKARVVRPGLAVSTVMTAGLCWQRFAR